MSDDVDEIRFEHDGATLHAFARGPRDARAIILLHGGLADHRATLYGLPLVARYRVIAPDLRGAGRSHSAGPLSWARFADDVAALARHLGLARAVIGGASFGSGVAVATALRHPDLVEAALFLHPVYAGGERGLTDEQRQAMDAMDAAGRRAPAEGMAVMFPLLARLPPEIQARAQAMMASFDPASVAATTAFLASGAQPFARADQLRAITAPALVVPGIDPQHPAEVAALYAQHLPRATVRAATIEGFAAAIDAFLAALG